MITIFTAAAVPTETLDQLHTWFTAEWGEIDGFETRHPGVTVPPPIVAVDDQNSLVGGLSFTSSTQPDSTQPGVWINMVLVSPDHRQKGIATRLVQAAEIEATKLGVRELFVLSQFPTLYQRLGWYPVGTDKSGEQTILHKVV